MGRRISLLLTMLSVALIAALLPAASFADPAEPPIPPISYPATGLNPPANLEGIVIGFVEVLLVNYSRAVRD